jgi:hypothetical protein
MILGASLAASLSHSTGSFTNAASAGFNFEAQCDQTVQDEGGTTIDTFSLIAIASSGSFGSLDYVQRRIQASVSLDPP